MRNKWLSLLCLICLIPSSGLSTNLKNLHLKHQVVFDMSTDAQTFYQNKRDALIKDFEKFRADPYLDSVGVPTIGYGTTQYPDGRKSL